MSDARFIDKWLQQRAAPPPLVQAPDADPSPAAATAADPDTLSGGGTRFIDDWLAQRASGTDISTPDAPKPVPKPKTVLPDGTPIYADPADNAAFREGKTRAWEKAGEGATMGLLPYGIAAAKMLTGKPFSQGLQEARDYTAQTSRDRPGTSMFAEGIGGLLPGLGFGGLARGGASLGGRALRSAGAGGLFGAANEAGHDIGMGTMSNFGFDLARGALTGGAIGGAAPLVGAMLQAPINLARGGAQAVRSIASGGGRDAIAGQVLREAGGDFQGSMARSPLPGLELRTAQATGNPGIAALERTLGSEPGAAGTAGNIVQNGRTPDQTRAVAQALVGADAGVEPAVLTNQSSARGTNAIRAADDALGAHETTLWQSPQLQGVALNGPNIASGVVQDVAGMPASWRDAVTGPQAKLAPFLRELRELPEGATVQDLNSIRSRLLKVARDAGSGATPDSVTAAAAGEMARSMLRRIESDPAIVGAAARTYTPTRAFGDAGPPTQPVHVPEVPPNPQVQAAYNRARDFSRDYHTTTGYPEFSAILNPNRAGNVVSNDERAFGRFFDPSGGTQAGVQRLQGLSDTLRRSGNEAAANELEEAVRAHMRTSLLAQGRAGAGLDPTGQPAMNLASTASAVNRSMPTINAAPMLAGEAPQIQAAGNAAELLNRPSTLASDTNSTTYGKLRNRELISAIVGQAGSSGAGALAGGYAGAKYGPDATPGGPLVNALLGAGIGLVGGSRAAPMLGSIVSKIPGSGEVMKGPTQDIMRRIASGLASPAEYQRLIQLEMARGPDIGARGGVSALAEEMLRASLPSARSGRITERASP